MTTRAAVYLRISLDRYGDEKAVDRQREDCLRLIEYKQWELAGEYVDNSVSATSGKTRPAYQRMIADIRAGKVDAVVVWRLDRLTRRTREIEDWIDLHKEYGVNLVTVEGSIDLSTVGGRSFVKMLANMAQAEVETKGDRQHAAIEQAIRNGAPITGRKVMGWRIDGKTIVKKEADLIRETYDAVLAGASLTATAKRWNELGHTTSNTFKGVVKEPRPWTALAIKTLLVNPRYAGFRADSKGVLHKGQWRAIVSEDTWRAAVDLLTDPERSTGPGPARRYLLSGIAVCGWWTKNPPDRAWSEDLDTCDAPMGSGGALRGVNPGYKCTAHPHNTRKGAVVDEYVIERVINRLAKGDVDKLLGTDEGTISKADSKRLVEVRAKLKSLPFLWKRTNMSDADYIKLTDDLNAELSKLEDSSRERYRVDKLGALVAAGQPQGDETDDEPSIAARRLRVRTVWDGLDLDRQRAVVNLAVRPVLMPLGGGRHEHLKPQSVGLIWHV